jgi:MinD-like ATPase involved in chromosome partitioning or flagellar assembly
LIPRIRELSDSGEPTVIADSDSEAANAFRSLAKKVAAALSVLAVRRGAK